MKQSAKFSFNKADLKSILVHGLILAASAFVAYLLEAVTKVNFGVHTTEIVLVISLILKAIQKFLTGK